MHSLAEPVEVLSVLVKELVHTALPAGAGHGKLFKAAALKLGLQGPMRRATASVLLHARLADLAAMLGPLPHASLHIDQGPLAAVALDRPRKQRARMLKAECEGGDCGYTVRVASKWARDLGSPHCPKHGAMAVTMPHDADEAEPEAGAGADDEAAMPDAKAAAA